MKRAGYLRRHAFWLVDSLKGGHVNDHYNEIKFILLNIDHARSVQLRNKYLVDILNHAIKTTSFYSCIQNATISDFPVIDKNIIRDNFNAFKSRDERYKQAVSVVTSGSTGTPFSLDHDKRKRFRNAADTIFFGELAGFKIGYKLYYFKIWNRINRKSKLSALSQNIIPYDVSHLSDDSVESIINILRNDLSKKAMLAYSSVYDSICQYLLKHSYGQINNNTMAIVAMSEALSQSTKHMMTDYFNVHPVSRYSNVENGIIAQQLADGSDEFLINEAGYFVELLEINSDKVVPHGVPGRIVITDFFNYCMPLIRYDTGDIGVFDKKLILGHQREVFKLIEGRRMDQIYDTTGKLVSSYIITNNMWKYRELRQYQFIQTSRKDYVFRLNTDLPFKKADELIEEFRGYLGTDADIGLEYVQEIPLLKSGKRKKVMNISNNF